MIKQVDGKGRTNKQRRATEANRERLATVLIIQWEEPGGDGTLLMLSPKQ